MKNDDNRVAHRFPNRPKNSEEAGAKTGPVALPDSVALSRNQLVSMQKGTFSTVAGSLPSAYTRAINRVLVFDNLM